MVLWREGADLNRGSFEHFAFPALYEMQEENIEFIGSVTAF